MPAPDPSIPPLAKVANEPFGDSSSFKFNDDVVLEKLNDFADSTYKIGESLFRRIVLGDFFSRSSSAQMNPFASKNEEDNKREAPESLDDGENSKEEVDQDCDDDSETSRSVLAGRGN